MSATAGPPQADGKLRHVLVQQPARREERVHRGLPLQPGSLLSREDVKELRCKEAICKMGVMLGP